MRFPWKQSLAAVALVGGTVLATTRVTAPQGEGEGEDDGMAAVMMKMMELATPGEPHAELQKLVGKWKQEFSFRFDPNVAEWMETTGSSEIEPMLGGRYIHETVEFEMMGTPIEGVSILGYDNLKGEYLTLWADSMSTWWVTARGEMDGDTLEMKGTMVDVAGERPYRMVTKHVSDDRLETTMYDTIEPHGEVVVMKIVSTREGSE